MPTQLSIDLSPVDNSRLARLVYAIKFMYQYPLSKNQVSSVIFAKIPIVT